MNEPVQSLAEVVPGRGVVVCRILFECLQKHCAQMGLREGDRLSLVRGDRSALLLRKSDGQFVTCLPDLVRFIEVRPEAASSERESD